MKKSILIIVILFIILAIVLPTYAQSEISNVKAKIIKDNGIEEENETTNNVQNLIVKILEGEYEGEEYEIEYTLSNNLASNNTISNQKLNEKDIILINLQQENGEITNISYNRIINQNYMLYCIAGICFICILIIAGKNKMGVVLKYLVLISLSCYVLIMSIIKQWNLILISGILSLLITVYIYIIINKSSKKSIIYTTLSLLIISFTGIVGYVLFDIIIPIDPMLNMNISNVSINIKDLFCSLFVLVSCGVCNSFINIHMINLLNDKEKTTYNIKSQNIIEGQRSLKL